MKIDLTKEEIQLIIQVLENLNIPIKQAEEFVIPLLNKLRKELKKEEE